MKDLIRLVEALRQEWSASALALWLLVLPVVIILGLVVLRWIRRGGLTLSSSAFFAKRRAAAQKLARH